MLRQRFERQAGEIDASVPVREELEVRLELVDHFAIDGNVRYLRS